MKGLKPAPQAGTAALPMTSLAELSRLDATAQAELCRARSITPDELWDACQRRISALNPLLNAVVTVATERSRPSPGPFHGVPFLMKDASPWPSMRWTLGSRLFGDRKNVAGAPAMSVPLFWWRGGLPIGTHLAAAPGEDALLLGLAYQLEEARPWRERWPPFSCERLGL